MTISPLGRLERVDLREVWTGEASGFTPWLASEENLALLGKTISVDLELGAIEKWVGPFRADIVCKDTATGAWVLIENQLERTDHTHLGQLLTYAAGLKAVTIVWIAQHFTEEHRAALDWLNEVTHESVNFFGLEIEIWRIGDSARAPKFNVVCQPNEWIKSTTAIATEPSTTQQLYAEWYSGLMDYIEEHNTLVTRVKPAARYWANFGVGRSAFSLQSLLSLKNRRLGVNLSIFDPNSKPHFHLLRLQQTQIEAEAGQSLEWRELPTMKSSDISTYLWSVELTDRDDWPRQHKWVAEKLDLFHKIFSWRVKALYAADYVPNDLVVDVDTAPAAEDFSPNTFPQDEATFEESI